MAALSVESARDGKENRKALHRRFALKRGPQFLVGGHATAHKKGSNVIRARRRQRLHDQVVDHGALKRSHQVEDLPVTKPADVFERRLVDAAQSACRRASIAGFSFSVSTYRKTAVLIPL